ncbi:hypothetical protein EX30DRAFT_372283 [Ascodesmis nigricans]|uniref:Uncharacterized protein n=1 Tax=Ascodesmis nigricans TaxID=341454 RepID=A0A4S2MUQ7_9PEZI|nr:hypothetical protein EX30DRAFT_372283 [Ascodesmis nigricans]
MPPLSQPASCDALDALYDTPNLSMPATPTDVSSLKSTLLAPYSSIVGTSILEEEEDNYEGYADRDAFGMPGLGLAMKSTNTVSSGSTTSVSTSSDYHDMSHYHNNEKLAPVTMPPTPPSHIGERPYGGLAGASAIDIHAEAFSAPASIPQSPQQSVPPSRTAIILDKVLPSKLRASLKRRLSSPNQPSPAQRPPPMPELPEWASAVTPNTPPEETNEFLHAPDASFKTPLSAQVSPNTSVSAFTDPDHDPILPPAATFNAIVSSSPTHHSITSRRGSPVGISFPSEVFPDMSQPASPTDIISPLHPPLKSPLASTFVPSSLSSTQHHHGHRKARSIDPATPLAPFHPPLATSGDITPGTIIELREEMNSDLAAYDATLKRMSESGWCSPQEITNVECQRSEKMRMWIERIDEARKVLEAGRRAHSVGGGRIQLSPLPPPPEKGTVIGGMNQGLGNVNVSLNMMGAPALVGPGVVNAGVTAGPVEKSATITSASSLPF